MNEAHRYLKRILSYFTLTAPRLSVTRAERFYSSTHYFRNALFSISHTPLAFIFVPCRYKSTSTNPTVIQISSHRSQSHLLIFLFDSLYIHQSIL